MDKLKALVEKKKQAAKTAAGERTWMKRTEREQLEKPSRAKVARVQPDEPVPLAPPAVTQTTPNPDVLAPLPDAEVKRRLRRLGEPVTLFGEDADVRRARLQLAEATLEVPDDDEGAGERANVLLSIAKEDRERAKRSAAADAGPSKGGGGGAGPAAAGAKEDKEQAEGERESEVARQFREAAERLKAKRELESLSADARIAHSLKRYMREWKEDLDRRPPEAVATTMGLQATNGYRQTERSFETLYARLEAGEVHHEIRACLSMIIDAIEQRNYQRANEVYLQLSIGNQAWPIGVTSIGIHDRSAREALAHHRNVKSQAHIMNDEATRKYLHGVSRLIKGVQGLRPTDPSRSVNFNAFEHAGLGAKGGMQKAHLLQLKAAGDTWNAQGMAATPHLLDKHGEVAIPPTFGQNLLKAAGGAAAEKEPRSVPR